MKLIQSYFGGVGLIEQREDMASLRVARLEHLTKVIIPHFDNHPLITQKKADFELFKRAAQDLVNRKEHLTVDGLQDIVNLKSSINLGLSLMLNNAFPGTVSSTKILVKNQEIPNPN